MFSTLTTFFYLFSVVSLLNFSHPFLFWFAMELNLMLFCLMIFSNLSVSFSNDTSPGIFFYFIVQSTASFLFIFLCFASESPFFSSISSLLLLSLMFFKLGLFPFQFWVYKFCFFSGELETFLILVVQKIPFLVLVFSMDWPSLIFLVLASTLAGCMFIWKSKSLIEILVSSSIYVTLWVSIMLYHSMGFFYSFFFCYGLFTFLGCSLKSKSLAELEASGSGFTVILLGMFLVGLPPLSFFFFKFFLLQNLPSFSLPFGLALWALTFGAMMGYFKLFFKFLFIGYKEVKSSKMGLVTLMSIAFFFFFF